MNKALILSLFSLITMTPAVEAQDRPARDRERGGPQIDAGLKKNEEGAFEGYTFFAPIRSKATYLIDMNGEVVHEWPSEHPPGNSAYLMQDGSIVRTAQDFDNPTFHGGGSGGRIQHISWDGELLWDFLFSNEEHMQHHDIALLPNGNVLMIAWEFKTPEEAIAAGREPSSLGEEGVWPDTIIEVKPDGKTGGEIVWEWHLWDHLVQDIDEELANYGEVSLHPELVNVNHAARGDGDWNHTNSINYNAELDQVTISVRTFNELWVIDHSTTTEEAASHEGGARGRGGDILYRWGNPAAYGRGNRRDMLLYGQHDVQWIEDELPGEGNLLIFNNGGRDGREHSTVDELVVPLNKEAVYTIDEDAAYGPKKAHWSYGDKESERFSSGFISGAQRLKNGNTLICSGADGRLFEVTPENEIVWEYVNPFFDEGITPAGRRGPNRGRGGGPPNGGPPGRGQGPGGSPDGGPPGRGDRPGRGGRPGGGGPGGGAPNIVFRALRFAPDHPSLSRLNEESDTTEESDG
jgi:hypothetical protein